MLHLIQLSHSDSSKRFVTIKKHSSIPLLENIAINTDVAMYLKRLLREKKKTKT